MFIFTFSSGNKTHTAAIIVLSVFRIACTYFSVMKFLYIYSYVEREIMHILKTWACRSLSLSVYIFSSHPFTANPNYFRDEEMKCYFWRKDWSFIRIVQKMTQLATHSDLKAFKCCFVPMLISIQSSYSRIKWASFSQRKRHDQHRCWCHPPCVCQHEKERTWAFQNGLPNYTFKKMFCWHLEAFG